MTLHVELVSPEQVLYSGDASMVVARTSGGGDIAFLTGHAPFLGRARAWRGPRDRGRGRRAARRGVRWFRRGQPRSSLDPERRGRARRRRSTSTRRGACATKPRTSCGQAPMTKPKLRCGWPTSGSPPRERRRPPATTEPSGRPSANPAILLVLVSWSTFAGTGRKGSEREVPAAPPALDPSIPPLD